MRGKKAKRLREQYPNELPGLRRYVRHVDCDTIRLHPNSGRALYQRAKRAV